MYKQQQNNMNDYLTDASYKNAMEMPKQAPKNESQNKKNEDMLGSNMRGILTSSNPNQETYSPTKKHKQKEEYRLKMEQLQENQFNDKPRRNNNTTEWSGFSGPVLQEKAPTKRTEPEWWNASHSESNLSGIRKTGRQSSITQDQKETFKLHQDQQEKHKENANHQAIDSIEFTGNHPLSNNQSINNQSRVKKNEDMMGSNMRGILSEGNLNANRRNHAKKSQVQTSLDQSDNILSINEDKGNNQNNNSNSETFMTNMSHNLPTSQSTSQSRNKKNEDMKGSSMRGILSIENQNKNLEQVTAHSRKDMKKKEDYEAQMKTQIQSPQRSNHSTTWNGPTDIKKVKLVNKAKFEPDWWPKK